MGAPDRLTRLLARGAARVFGGFRLRDADAVEALRHAKVPVLLLHGEADRLVPCEMSAVLEAACAAPVRRYTFPDAGHGLSFLADRERYTKAVVDFLAFAREEKEKNR